MRIHEKIYIGLSSLMLLASLSLVFYDQIGVYFWRSGHSTIIGFIFTALFSLLLGILGIFFIMSAKKREEKIKALVLTNLSSVSYFVMMLLNFILIKFLKIFWIA